MRHVEVNGVRVSRIGVGCWQFGSRDWGYGPGYESTAVAIIHRARELGVTLIDTAELYARGASEAIVGRALAPEHRGAEIITRREGAFVATKLWPVLPTAGRTFEHGRLSRARLGIDTIDLYQVHFPNPVVPLRQTMEGMRRLQDEGVVRHVGVSNYGADWWRRAEADLGRPVLSNQVQYSLARRRPERAVLPFAQQHDRLVIAYSPLAQGLLGGRYDVDHRPTNPARRQNPLFLTENLQRADVLIRALREVAAAHDATPAQVALAWLLRRPNVVAIPGASTVEQLEHNVAAADLDLTADEDDRLTGASDTFDPLSAAAAVPRLVKARFTRAA
jgi:aryl-alcohol dehydrogenase-like predicted oxidoreductase